MDRAIKPMFAPALGGALNCWIGWKANFYMIGSVCTVIWFISILIKERPFPKARQALERNSLSILI